ncbi:MAG: TolC family protein [Steroidobacteraceae bacterium]
MKRPFPYMCRNFHPGLWALPLLLLEGCASYQPMPLIGAGVDRALTAPSAAIIEQEASHLHHPILRPIALDPREPLSPQEAAVLAVLINPTLRAERDRVGVSGAQLIAAGLLPNPQLSYSMDFITSGPGITRPFGIGASWDITSLVTHDVKLQAARASLASVRLDVAWAEWQAAEAAKAAVFDAVALGGEVKQAQGVDQRLEDNLRVIRGAYDRHQRTILQLSAARAASATAHASALALEQQLDHQRLVLLQALGLPAGTSIALRPDIALSSRLTLPSAERLLDGLEERRLDLVALRRGYESQEQNVRAAILAQFPKINLGANRAKDNTGVYSIGFSAAVELPIFNRNQESIALQRATRQQLYDEYVSRVFQARSDIAMLLKEAGSLTEQISAAEDALPSLRQLVETYRIAIERGNADVLNYYTAWNNLSQRHIDLLKLKQQLSRDRISLELAAGEDLTQPTSTAMARATAQPPVSGPQHRAGAP